jgi:hypothetical protein
MIIKIDIREQELIVQLQRLIALNDIFKNINVEKVNLPIGDIIIFDPYYCDGMMKKYLNELGR